MNRWKTLVIVVEIQKIYYLYNIYPIVYKMLYRNNKTVRSNNKMNDSIWISIL